MPGHHLAGKLSIEIYKIVSCAFMYSITVATSIAPKHIEKQIIAVDSWLILGLQVISVNHPTEIIELSPLFPNVLFIPAAKVATRLTGKPLVFLDDLLSALHASGAGICGIINSDIVLRSFQELPAFLQNHCIGSFVYGPRLDVENLHKPEGGLYQCGRDYFFFERSFIGQIPASDFSIGSPWWDIWLPLVAVHVGKQLIQPLDWIALHTHHPVSWDQEVFWTMGTIFLNLVSQYKLNVQKHSKYHFSSELMLSHRHQNAMIILLYKFLTEKTLILPVSPTDARQLTANITLNPFAKYSLIFPFYDGRDVQFLLDCIEELEQLAFGDSIEVIIIIEFWNNNHTLYDYLVERYDNITFIRMLTRVDKQSALDAASRFAQGKTIISMDNVMPYYTDDPDEMNALRTYYKKRFYKHIDKLACHLKNK